MTREINAILFDWDFTLGRVLGDYSFEERLSRLLAGEGLIVNIPNLVPFSTD